MLETLKITVGGRWRLIALLFVAEVALIVFVSNSPFFSGELTSYTNQYNNIKPVLNQTAPGQVTGIFANNFRVATIELIPALGPLIFALSIYETARIVEVIGVINPEGIAGALGTLFILPSTWLELPAYAIAAAESIYLLYAVYRGFKDGWARLVREFRFLIVNVILIAGVLIVAATFEVTEIQIESGPVQTQAYVLLTWLPFALVFAGVLVFWRRAKRDAPALEARDAAEAAQDASGSQVISDQGQPQPQGEKDSAGSPTSSP